MPETMTAAVYQGAGSVTVESIAVPHPEAGEALIKVHYTGICGTDMDIFAGKHPRAKAPLVMGHEFSGDIVEIDPAFGNRFPVGSRVTVEPLISCGACYACLSGFEYVCQSLRLYGIDRDGSMAQYVKVNAKKLYAIPESFSYEQAAMIEPTAVAVHAVRIADVKLNDTVVVLGGGLIGSLIVQVVKLVGPREIIVTDVNNSRLNDVRKYGCTTVNSAENDPIRVVMDLTKGRGADVVFEVTGREATAVQMGKMARVRGEIVMVGMPKDPPKTDLLSIGFKELTIKGVRVYAPFDFERAIDIASRGLVDVDSLISHRLTLSEAPMGFELKKSSPDAMKVLIRTN